MICGRPLVYSTETVLRECCICHRLKPSDAACEAGHFVCDDCHAGGGAAVLAFLQDSDERDAVRLYLEACRLPGVHMHGPEHHSIVPCVLLTAFRNCGGPVEDLAACLGEAWKRGRKVPGGACGFLGACGAAIGAGICASMLCESTPLAGEVWARPQSLTAECLAAISAVGGPRCCKRTGRLAIETAAGWLGREYGISMPASRPECGYKAKNRECLRGRCPFYSPEG